MKGGIRQRSPGAWELTLNLGRDAQGIRRRRSVTVRGTKAQAQRRLRELLADFDKGIAPPDPVVIRDWLDRWMTKHIIPRSNQATSERYAAIIATHLKPRFGQLELNRLTPAQVRVMESDLVDGGLSPKPVALIHNVLSGAYRYAMQMEMVQRNPVSLVSPPPVRKTETVAPPIEAVQQLLELAEPEEHPRFTCIHLLAYTGLRLGEALALKWDALTWMTVTCWCCPRCDACEPGTWSRHPKPPAANAKSIWTARRSKCCAGTGNVKTT